MNRRRVLAGIVAGFPFFAGCSALSGGDDDNGGDSRNTTGQQNGTTPTETPPPTTAGAKMAETVQQTLTQTATATLTATMRTAAPTTTASRMTGAPVIDPSNLTTYTSETYPFSVKYPADWAIDETPSGQSGAVTFTAPSGVAQMDVGVITEVQRSMSLNRLVTETIRSMKQSAEQGEGTINSVNRREVTLPNGHRAIVVEITGTTSSDAGRQLSSVITLVNGTAYLVSVSVPKRKHTPTVEQGITKILTSLTVSETAPSPKNQTKAQTPDTTNIDLSNLATYTSDSYPFSIKYPAGWVVDKTDTEDGTVDGDVKFDIPRGVATEFAQRTEVSSLTTLEQSVSLFSRGFKQRIEKDGGDYKKLGKRTVTLSNGHRAVIVEFQFSAPLTDTLRGKRIHTLVDQVLYTASIWVPKRAYTPAVEQSMNTIVTSLTVTETATTTGNRTTSTTSAYRRQP